MTLILKMVCKGFKSFANKTEFNFSNKFNCIIGPNGSGKSNVLDSLCFVLGRTSVKSLRADKSASLIYNGGKTKEPAKEGMVEITFSNDDHTFPIDAPTVTVTRIVKHDGTGVYKINEKKVTRQEIHELLLNARIDPDGYNIILQGDIIHMIDMSDVERRQVIEDVAGIGIYEERKDKALGELEKVEQKFNDTELILNERETRIKELKTERDQAIKYKDITDKISTNKALRVRAQVRERQKKIEDAEADIKSMNEKSEVLKKENDLLSEKLKKATEDIANINSDIEQKGEKEQLELQKLIEKLKIDFATNNSKIENLGNEIQRVIARRGELEADIKSVQTKIGDFDFNKKTLTDAKKLAEKNIGEIEEKIKIFKEKNKIEDTHKIDEQIDAIDKTIEELAKKIEEMRLSQQNLFREKDQMEFKLNSIDEQMFKLKEMGKESQEQIEQLKNKQEQFKKTTLDLNKLLSEDSSTNAQIANARNKLEFSQSELSKLEAKKQTAAAALAGNTATREILEQKQNGTIKGIIGLVSELGNVKKEYAAALEVAASTRIKGIVVEDDAVASKCISYLKSNKLGSATFLPLNKIRGQKVPDNLKEILKQEGVYGLCTELIFADPKYNTLFSYVFGPTIVVKDIPTARKIGIGVIRMVTLDGDLVESSGAMTGGYKKDSIVGAFKDEDVAKKIDELTLEVSEGNALLSALSRKKQENEDAVQRHRTLKAELEAEILTLTKTLKLDETDTTQLKENKKTYEKRIKEIDDELNKMNNNLGLTNKEAVSKKIEKQMLKNKVSELRNPLKLAELNTLESQRQNLREEIIKYESEIKSLDIQIKDIVGPEEDKITKILKQLDKEEVEFKEDIKKMKETNSALEKDIKEKEKSQKEFYSKFKEAFNKRAKLSDDAKSCESKMMKNSADQKIIESKVNMVILNLTQYRVELSGFEKEFELYKDLTLPETDKSESDIRADLDRYEKRLIEMGNVNMKALEIYEQVEQEYNKLKEKKETLVVEKEDIMIMINEIETNKKEIFMKTFNEVNERFKRIFVTLSTKGEAFLDLEFPDTPFNGGMTMKVKLNTNKFMDIRSLSGGEKTMTALALLFAIQEYEPASFYVLDEVDAALDKRNSERLAELVNQYTGKAQYVIISHNDGVIAAADTLFGVSMDEHGMSKVTSLKV